MPAAVSDSSPLIHLAVMGRLDLLRTFHEPVMIPPAVWHEVVGQGGGRPGAREVQQAKADGWLKVEAPAPTPTLNFLRGRLDVGEAEAVALALERQPEVLLLDEGHGRAVARQFGLNITGTVGMLIRARLGGQIPNLRTELDQLRGPAGCYLGQSVYEAALRAVGE